MTIHNHAVVWINHRVAKIFFLGLDAGDELTIHSELSTEHLYHKANTIGSGKVHEDPNFFPYIEEALQHSEAILIVGPGNEKTAVETFQGRFALAQGARPPRRGLRSPDGPRNHRPGASSLSSRRARALRRAI
jgi:hypothetical protein